MKIGHHRVYIASLIRPSVIGDCWANLLNYHIENYLNKPLIIFTKSFFNLLGSVLSVFGIFLTKGFSASSIHITDGCSSLDTFITKCINIIRPVFPGYLPTMFAGVRSNNVAPASLQVACIINFLPLPEGPLILKFFHCVINTFHGINNTKHLCIYV